MRPILFLDMDGVIADLGGRQKMLPIEECPEYNEPEFWLTLPKLSWADDLVKACINYFQVYILTSPCGSGSIIGKEAWMVKWYPDLASRMIYTAHKHLLAAPTRILVDDDPKNCARFRQFGGIAIEVPNPIRFPDRPQFPQTDILGMLSTLAKVLSHSES